MFPPGAKRMPLGVLPLLTFLFLLCASPGFGIAVALNQLAEKRMHIRHPFMLETEV